jgi:hypothetical protein
MRSRREVEARSRGRFWATRRTASELRRRKAPQPSARSHQDTRTAHVTLVLGFDLAFLEYMYYESRLRHNFNGSVGMGLEESE